MSGGSICTRRSVAIQTELFMSKSFAECELPVIQKTEKLADL
jgi:hypothetical protein